MNELLRKAQAHQAVTGAGGGGLNIPQEWGNVTMSNTVGANYMNATTVAR